MRLNTLISYSAIFKIQPCCQKRRRTSPRTACVRLLVTEKVCVCTYVRHFKTWDRDYLNTVNAVLLLSALFKQSDMSTSVLTNAVYLGPGLLVCSTNGRWGEYLGNHVWNQLLAMFRTAYYHTILFYSSLILFKSE